MTYTRMETEPMSDGGNESEWIENSKKLEPIHRAREEAFFRIKELEAEIERLRSALSAEREDCAKVRKAAREGTLG